MAQLALALLLLDFAAPHAMPQPSQPGMPTRRCFHDRGTVLGFTRRTLPLVVSLGSGAGPGTASAFAPAAPFPLNATLSSCSGRRGRHHGRIDTNDTAGASTAHTKGCSNARSSNTVCTQTTGRRTQPDLGMLGRSRLGWRGTQQGWTAHWERQQGTRSWAQGPCLHCIAPARTRRVLQCTAQACGCRCTAQRCSAGSRCAM